MPRPPLKRRKPNQKSPKGRVESPKNAQLRQQLDRQLAQKPVGQRPADSDDSDRLVTRTPNAAGRSSVLRKEIYASGAIAKGDRPGAYPTRAERRRNLQKDTAQIIRQSRSRSQSSQGDIADPDPPTKTKPATKIHPPTSQKTIQQQKDVVPEAPTTIAKVSRADGMLRIAGTPMGETSILGTLKPRRRQVSILHLIDNEDSSVINPEDEDRFLPDDESTPLNANKVQTAAAHQRLLSSASSSRKRKFGSDVPQGEPNNSSTPGFQASSFSPQQALEASSPPKSSATYRPSPMHKSSHQSSADDDVDIMAMPLSSSAESTPEKKKQLHRPDRRQEAAPVSTEQLRSLMPSKRRRGARERTKLTEFDISEDTSDSIEDANDSVFLLKKRAPQHQRKALPNKTTQGRKRSTATRTQSKKSTTLANPRRVSVSLRTPLPLTRSINAENRKLRSTSSQHFQSTESEDPDSKQSGRPTSRATRSAKQSGGSRRTNTQRGRDTGENTPNEAICDQENLDSASLPKAVPKDSLLDNDAGGVGEYGVIDDEELEIQVGRGTAQDRTGFRESKSITPSDMKGSHNASTWKNKWNDIDDWSLDFEEVDISTGSSSPLRR